MEGLSTGSSSTIYSQGCTPGGAGERRGGGEGGGGEEIDMLELCTCFALHTCAGANLGGAAEARPPQPRHFQHLPPYLKALLNQAHR